MTERPIRVQLSRRKGWKMPANTVKVDRSGGWGNPFRVGEPPSMSAAKWWGWKFKNPDLLDAKDAHEAVRLFKQILVRDHASVHAVRFHLRGKNLACWCKLTDPCHADVLLELANP